MRTFILIIYFR